MNEDFFSCMEEEVRIMNKLFKGTAQDYLRLRAKKHRWVYNNEEGAVILEKLADDVDLLEENLKNKDRKKEGEKNE